MHPTLRLVVDTEALAPDVSPSHAVITEPDLPGWSRITVRHAGRGVIAHGCIRNEELTTKYLQGIAQYFLGSPSAVIHHTRREATG